ncbi:hypothetical protein GF339_16260, partial [candidate division KSB3 bacterium]|nr:hypothetical protein [candidate division KSB3 bacterium]MBD3326141.1 hypothetical protein [candidate division KSB3 bacterium]
MKKMVVLLLLLFTLSALSGCSFLEGLLDVLPGIGDDDDDDDTGGGQAPYRQPEVLCTYFHYFRAGPDRFDQWWLHGKDPRNILGPEQWRRDVWIGRTGDYPYIGIYNNVSDAEIMRWHIRLAKAAGISAFLVYINNWQEERPQTDLLLTVAQQENFKIGFVEHHSFLGARSIRMLDGRPQPLLPEKYIGYDEIMEKHAQELGLPLPP